MKLHALVLKACLVTLGVCLALPAPADSQESIKLFISVDLEGIGGVGSPLMTSSGGKDYETSRQYMTQEVNSVVGAIFEHMPSADILVNDSHGDHQNVLHGELDPRIRQGQRNGYSGTSRRGEPKCICKTNDGVQRF